MKKIILRTGIIASAVALVACLNAPKMPEKWEEYIVGRGDTLCEISMSIVPEKKDYREAEYWITKKNNIERANIYPGQTILVPVYE